jgi:hypothetical protein
VTVFASLLAGCAVGADTTSSSADEIDREKELQRRLEVRQGAYRQLPQATPEDPQPGVVGEVPDSVLLAIRTDLAKKLDADPAVFQVVSARSVTWNDGSLGCPRPGEAYTQALVPGYQVVLEYGGNTYDYRAAENGFFFLCELPTLPRSSPDLQ